ncbi:hypothetical protein V1512DRAFT_160114 [Lipomyces arxii]|uniref:uncharacterized protein n=1 Tax=Lipomyces arxii TaxID=56418 RepID=UPI0034CD6CE7
MSRLAQDSFISDDEEEVCPLCVEEFDISDKGFKPCPCGYQVCQFCYNNIRQNPQLNGRCPGCRRPYDDASVEYKIVTAEEWRQDHQKQTRREKEKKQKERERKEIEQASRKHLSGMRVIQKNLVYVLGLNPHIPHEELHNTLRGEQFFGQYGKIQKIVVNRRNGGTGAGGIGVYVTYYKKEDAAKCIAAVDGSSNDGKVLRAAYGTTKYCSSYLRNQSCPNPNCMFLHEPGEEADSYTRQDLSTIQHAARQVDVNAKPGLSRQSTASSFKPVSLPKAVEEPLAPEPQQEQSALPPTVSWAAKASPPVQNSKLVRSNTAGQISSPLRPSAEVHQISTSQIPSDATPQPVQQASAALQSQLPHQQIQQQTQPQQSLPAEKLASPKQSQTLITHDVDHSSAAARETLRLFEDALRLLSTSSSVRFAFSTQILAKDEMIGALSMPPLFAFSSEKAQNGSNGFKAGSQPKNGTHARQGSRYSFTEKASNSEHLLEQQQMMNGGNAFGGQHGDSLSSSSAFENGQLRNDTESISKLMSAGRLKVSLPGSDMLTMDDSLSLEQQSQPQGVYY